ncbi:MAG TPA: hypothetical protein VKV80_12590 [Streptosporangiaceae bacterium]|nr:hypothetical protein [Streptosporangiaceae bacterium]
MTHHRSRLRQFVIDVDDLDQGVTFWAGALGAAGEPLSEISSHICRQLRLPGSKIRILLQATTDPKHTRSGYTSTWRPATSKPKSPARKHSAPPAGTTSKNAVSRDLELPGGGHEKCPLVAIGSAQ